ncbi:MAG: hypothetical protein ISS31_00635 [Kiritimatiellae bacterium]|nr:hypothetical protein [Kiritimatiellia bacterium]
MNSRFLLLTLILGVALPAIADWEVGDAPLRFTYHLSGAPTHESAGYFVAIPDGGILPKPYPVTHAFDSGGNPLKSYALWHNQASGLAIVFEAPTSENTVDIYVAPGRALELWNPDTGLTPSSILCANPDRGDMGAASRLAGLGSVSPRVHFRQNPGHSKSALSVSGDLTGRPAPCAFYLLSYLEVEKEGKTWLAPMRMSGQMEAKMNGKTISLSKRIDKWGGIGQYRTLSEGLHRLDLLSACNVPGPFSEGKGSVWMTWAPPGTKMEDLGGPRPKQEKFPGTAKWASRVVENREIVRSGSCLLSAVKSRDGTPVAAIKMQPVHNYWFKGEKPLIYYRMGAVTDGNPDDTTYTWTLPGKRQFTGAALPWIFAGAREHTIALTATKGKQQTRAMRPFYAYSDAETTLEDATAREAFRDACFAIVRATPEGADPTHDWDKSMWNNLARTLSVGEGRAFLATLFSKHWDALKRSAPRDQLAILQDHFLMVAPAIDPKAALEWTTRFEAAAGNRGMLHLRRAEILMYYMDDLDGARRILRTLATGVGETREWAKIRLGDVELLAGNLNEATRHYADVQDRFKAAKISAKDAPTLSRRLARTSEELKAQREARHRPRQQVAATAPVADWKMKAVLEASASETVRTYLDQGAYAETHEVLSLWERQFPLSKLSGDLTLLEARLYRALGQIPRARRLLKGYCDAVEASSYIGDALETLLDCMVDLEVPTKELREFCVEARKRLEFHPQAERFDRWIQMADDELNDNGRRAATKDTL